MRADQYKVEYDHNNIEEYRIEEIVAETAAKRRWFDLRRKRSTAGRTELCTFGNGDATFLTIHTM